MPLVKPVTVHEVARLLTQLLAPGDAVTVYRVIVDPPSVAGADQDTAAEALPGAALTPLAAAGTVARDAHPTLRLRFGEPPCP